MNCGTGYAKACGAEDCPRCHPENFSGGEYLGDDGRESPVCPACGAHPTHYMGRLGSLEWFRCRACGLDAHQDRDGAGVEV